jgi:hypothetical protein
MQRRLAAAVANQRRLAAWHLLQATLMQILDYAGAIIAYCCVGLVISCVSGASWSGTDESSGCALEPVHQNASPAFQIV